MKKICIYHNADLDGVCSAAIVKKAHPDCMLYGVNYGDSLPEEILNQAELIIIVDFSLHPEKMFSYPGRIIWIDHHFSAIVEYEKFPRNLPENDVVLMKEKAACELTWRKFFPDHMLPVAVHLLGIYDTWRTSEKPGVYDIDNPWTELVLPFQYFIRSLCHTPDTFPVELFDQHPAQLLVNYIQPGKHIIRYINQQNRILASNAFVRQINGYSAIILNQSEINSMAFDYCYDPTQHDIMVAYSFNGQSFRVSFYTTKDINVSAIAKIFGGGGHKSAAGCQIDKIEKLWTNTIGTN